ncbi:MAG: 50S ribosomal protein L24 [Gemmatimonadota bacterium]
MRRLTWRRSEGRRLGAVRHARKVERIHIAVTRGDTVRVMRGEDRGKEGKVLRVFPKTGRLTVEGINIVKRHRKARTAEEKSGIIDMPAPIHHSNVMLLDPKSGRPSRTRSRIDADGTKERISVRSGDAIPRTR